eukprot:9469211-Pyramimonas_sp.AAC.1
MEKSLRQQASLRFTEFLKSAFWNCMSTFLLWAIQSSARARGEPCTVNNRKVGASVGTLEGSQKI